MIKFFKKIFKKGKKHHHHEAVDAAEQANNPDSDSIADLQVASVPLVASVPQVASVPLVSSAPVVAIPQAQVASQQAAMPQAEPSQSIYGTRTKATAIKMKPKNEDVLKREKNTAVKVPKKNAEKALNEKAKEVAVSLEKNKKEDQKPECMQDELLRKAKEFRNRTHNHNHYYRGVGKDAHNLHGRQLKSIFENDAGEKLPYGERAELMRELQSGTRKHPWK